MNTSNRLTAWNWMPRWATRRRQLGFALKEAGRGPAVAHGVANARARFEHEARQALREWLML